VQSECEARIAESMVRQSRQELRLRRGMLMEDWGWVRMATRKKKAPAKKTAPAKKLGLESSATRIALLEAAERLIREQGFAAITSRIVAAEAGLKPQLIHYYFNSMDDLYVEVIRRGGEADLARIADVLEAEDPLRTLWEISSDPRMSRFVMEFMAIANHNAAVRAEISQYAMRLRELHVQLIARHFAARGITPAISPMVATVITQNLARGLALETALDISLGHEEMEAFVELCLQRVGESSAPAKPTYAPAARKKVRKPSAASPGKPPKQATRVRR